MSLCLYCLRQKRAACTLKCCMDTSKVHPTPLTTILEHRSWVHQPLPGCNSHGLRSEHQKRVV